MTTPKDKLTDAANKTLQKSRDKNTHWSLRLLYWIISLLLAGASTLYLTSCSLADTIVLTGQKGQITYYSDPGTKQKTITYTPVKILPAKK